MRPVVCANCGTKNPRGSKYCNECGHELIPTSTQLCPNCETSNPIDRLYCDNCGARLSAEEEPPQQEEKTEDDAPGAGSPEPFSLPSRPPGQTGRLELDRELPAWLRTGEEGEGEGEEAQSASATESEPSATDETEQASEEGAGEHRPADDLPDWLLDEDEASDFLHSEKTTDELFLASQEEGGKGDEEVEGSDEASLSPQEGKAEGALSDWLSGEGADAEDAYGEVEGEGLADWLEELEQEDDLAPAEEGLSDWLADLEGDGEEDDEKGEEARPADDSVGAWLSDLEGEEPEQDSAEEEPTGEGVADWLADLEGEDDVDREESGTPEVSDWLADLEEEVAVETSADPLPEGEEEASATADSAEAPLPWETEPAGEEPAETEAASDPESADVMPAEAGDDVPDWLAGLEEEAGSGAEEMADDDEPLPWERADDEATAGEEMAAEAPDWLAGLEEEVGSEEEGAGEIGVEPSGAADEEEAAVDAAAVDVGAEIADDAGVPDWLADLEEEADADADVIEEDEGPLPWEIAEEEATGEGVVEGVPDWLADLEEEADAEEGSVREEEVPTIEEGAFSEEAAADWLSRLHQESEEGEPEEEVAAGDSEAEIPAWLADLDSEAIQSARADEVAPEEPSAVDDAAEAEVDEVPDWLAAVDAEEEQGWPADEDAPQVDESFDWLGDVDVSADETVTAPEEGQEEELPDWLADEEQREPEGERSEREEPEPAAEIDEIPEWLQEMAPDVGAEIEEEEDEDLAAILGGMDAGDEMPDWLMEAEARDEVVSEGAPDEAEEFVAGLEEEDEEVLADWSEIPTAQEASEALPEEGEEVSPSGEADFADAAEEALDFGESFDLTVEMEDSDRVSDEDLPDWLGDVMADVDQETPPTGEEAEAPAAAEEPVPDLENVPEQLAGAKLPDWLEDSLPEEAAPAEPTPLEDMPDWIQAAGQPFLGQTEPTEEEAPAAGVEGEEEMEEIYLDLETSGEWEDLLEGLPPPEPTVEEVREAEIPEWVQAMKPKELTGEEPETPEPRTPAETSGPLAGLHGVIGVEPSVTEPRSVTPMSPLAPSKEQEQQAALLRQLTRSEESEAVVVAPAPETAGSPWVRALLTLLLVAAVLVGLFVPGLLETTPNASGVAEAQEVVAAAAGRPVLVAFDYTPATAAILDGQASLLLEALAEGDSPVFFISQSPAGLALAQQAVDQVDGLESHRLGYLPGEAIGLRRLTACLETGSACRPITGLGQQEAMGVSAADLGLIVVFAADRDSLINWIEQVDARTTVPMVVGVTQALAPVAGPYLDSGQLDGLLAGFPGTAAFRAETGELGNRMQAELEMLTLAQWLVVALLVVGNILYLAFGSRRSRAAKGEGS